MADADAQVAEGSSEGVDPRDITATLLCAEVFHQYGDVIRIRKAHIAVPNLEKILLAALELSARNGFHSTTTRDLAEHSGLSMGAIYTYVDSKETLLRMILTAVSHAVDLAVAPMEPGEAEDPLARLHGLIRRHVLLTENLQRWFYFAFLEVKAFDKQARAIAIAQELRTEALFAETIKAGQDRGLFVEVEPSLLAGLIKPLLQDWYLKRWKYRQRGISPIRFIALVQGFVDRAVAVPDPALPRSTLPMG